MRYTLVLALMISLTPVNGQTPEDARDKVYYPGDTESVKPLARKLAGNLWLDQKEIWTSPFRLKKKNAPYWIGFTAVTAVLIATDRRTSKTFENNNAQIRWGNRISDIGSIYTVIPVVAGIYSLGIWKDNPKARETGVLSAQALLDSLIVVEILKPIAGRNRPEVIKDHGNFFRGGRSFPSGHAMESWAFASVVSHQYNDIKWVPFVAYGLAASVSCARFAAQKHYASDIVAGGAMGWFIGRFVYRTHQDHFLHKHAWAEPLITPQFQPSSGTYAINLTFRPGL